MGDVNVQVSQFRITFTPTGGEPVLLLDVGDCVDAQPDLPLEPQVQTHELIARDFVAHHSRGNAEPRLAFDSYRRCMSQREAQRLPLLLWRKLCGAADGTLRLQTAFAFERTAPGIDWTFKATLARFHALPLSLSTAPFESSASAHIELEFVVTDPQDTAAIS